MGKLKGARRSWTPVDQPVDGQKPSPSPSRPACAQGRQPDLSQQPFLRRGTPVPAPRPRRGYGLRARPA